MADFDLINWVWNGWNNYWFYADFSIPTPLLGKSWLVQAVIDTELKSQLSEFFFLFSSVQQRRVKQITRNAFSNITPLLLPVRASQMRLTRLNKTFWGSAVRWKRELLMNKPIEVCDTKLGSVMQGWMIYGRLMERTRKSHFSFQVQSNESSWGLGLLIRLKWRAALIPYFLKFIFYYLGI